MGNGIKDYLCDVKINFEDMKLVCEVHSSLRIPWNSERETDRFVLRFPPMHRTDLTTGTDTESLVDDCRFVQQMIEKLQQRGVRENLFDAVRHYVSHIVVVEWDAIEFVDGKVRPKLKPRAKPR